VIKYPDNTKNISTPTYPKEKYSGHIWNSSTKEIAIPRSPSSAGLYFKEWLTTGIMALVSGF